MLGVGMRENIKNVCIIIYSKQQTAVDVVLCLMMMHIFLQLYNAWITPGNHHDDHHHSLPMMMICLMMMDHDQKHYITLARFCSKGNIIILLAYSRGQAEIGIAHPLLLLLLL